MVFQNVTTTNVIEGDKCFIGVGAILLGPIEIGNDVKGLLQSYLKMLQITLQ